MAYSALNLAETVGMDLRTPFAAAGACSCLACRVGMDGYTLAAYGHLVQSNPPETAFLNQQRFYLANYLRNPRFLRTFVRCRWALFLLCFHT